MEKKREGSNFMLALLILIIGWLVCFFLNFRPIVWIGIGLLVLIFPHKKKDYQFVISASVGLLIANISLILAVKDFSLLQEATKYYLWSAPFVLFLILSLIYLIQIKVKPKKEG